MPKFRPRHLITGTQIVAAAATLWVAVVMTGRLLDPALSPLSRLVAATLFVAALAGAYYWYLRPWMTIWRQKERRQLYRTLEHWLDTNTHGQSWVVPNGDVLLMARKPGWVFHAVAQIHRSDLDAPQIDAEHGVLTWCEYSLTGEYPHITRDTHGTRFTVDDDGGVVVPDDETPNSRWKAARAEIWATRRGANAASIEELRALVAHIQRAQPRD